MCEICQDTFRRHAGGNLLHADEAFRRFQNIVHKQDK